MVELIVRPLAEVDVRDAAFWYESKREGLGAEFALELDALYERIAKNPRQFPEIDEGVHRALLHRFPYAVYFMLGEDAPVIIAVLHQHRRPEAWRGRL
ncbi:MAG: type II toxin-antitoxin system RelE/ParE family toxin [Candidatus Binatia bacterium]